MYTTTSHLFTSLLMCIRNCCQSREKLMRKMDITISSNVQSFAMDFGDIRELMGFGREIVMGALESLEFIRSHGREDDEMNFPFIRRMEKRLLNEITGVDHRLRNMEEQINERATDIVDIILTELPQRQELDETLRTLDKYLRRVDQLYQKFIHYSDSYDKYSNYTKLRFAEECTSPHADSLPDVIESIHRLIVPKNFVKSENSLFEQLARSTFKFMLMACINSTIVTSISMRNVAENE
ncbi:hypothetical protein PV327_007677 [Microctonus hyperodae]|uniref:Uncharacterized protein n=1 Tax=Microctonus hyperodae TaxID=165561 RepID=A0AA39FZP3_MICHY|nr:hypothetical protein PV327_007677 [Microctonus hyperodae]